jgi:hypothetical protein
VEKETLPGDDGENNSEEVKVLPATGFLSLPIPMYKNIV